MDNLTHSLIGAALAQTGLKRKTGLAMPALILAANLPDIDAPCAIYGVESLTMRRGITHGPIALLVLPLVLAGLLILFDRWQARRGKRPEGRLPVHPGWLIALCYLGTLSHPLFDWFNNYGIRLLEPFSSRWFYGDTLFIIDVWILAMLGFGLWRSLKRERSGAANPFRPARAAVAGVAAYVLLNMAISDVHRTLAMGDVPYPVVGVSNALPVTFWRRDVLIRTGDGRIGTIPCSLLHCDRSNLELRPDGLNQPGLDRMTAGNPEARAFLFWSRMPFVEREGNDLVLRDQRFAQSPARDNFMVRLGPASTAK